MIGGLSTKITVLYDAYSGKTRRSYEGFRILEDMSALVAPRRRRKELSYNPRTIYALSSGMMTEGTTSNFFAQNFLGFENNSVAFVGYTDPSTPGWRVRHGQPGEMIRLSSTAPPVPLRCQVESFDFSAHSSRENICDYLTKVQPRKVLLVHGDEPAMNWFKQTLPSMLPESEIVAPEPRQEIRLW
jgi:predicted metal-dependent RNase